MHCGLRYLSLDPLLVDVSDRVTQLITMSKVLSHLACFGFPGDY